MTQATHRQRHRVRSPRATAAPIGRATGADMAGVGTTAMPMFGEELRDLAEQGSKRAVELAGEFVERVPNPMLFGLVAGVAVGATAMHFLGPKRPEADNHAAKIEAERRPSLSAAVQR